jgi:sugar/nucleoside kinase (ribokinase family)
MSDVYVYGMTVLSTIHQLKGRYPEADTYQEIARTYVMPGGEGANAAVVLSNLGMSTMLDGCYLGQETAVPLLSYLRQKQVDCSLLQEKSDFVGWKDIVLCDGASRTVFGWFNACFADERELWAQPDEPAIRQARCVALDPFFGAESTRVADLCRKHNTDYVTIDCKWDDAIAQHARAIVVSNEFIEREYPGENVDQLLNQYHKTCTGLVIFTFGSREILYVEPGMERPLSFKPFTVDVVDTLAAGDTFRAGVIYGILQQMNATETVRFAAATAAVTCTRFPSIHQPPDLAEILDLMSD